MEILNVTFHQKMAYMIFSRTMLILIFRTRVLRPAYSHPLATAQQPGDLNEFVSSSLQT